MYRVISVIPTFNRKQHILQVIADLKAQVLDKDIILETVVVVDGSTDGTLEMLRISYPEVHIVEGSGDWWYTRSMNEGFQRARELQADYILTMNDDVRLPNDYVQSLMDATCAEPVSTIMGSISVTADTPHRITFSGVKEIKWWRFKYFPYLPTYSEVTLDELSGVRPSKVLPGRGMLIPIEIMREIKGFDAKLVQYGSDDDYCLRAQKRGYAVKVCYDAVVHSYDQLTGVGHASRKDSLKDLIKAFRNRYSTMYLPKTAEMIRRHGNPLLMPFTLGVVILGSLAKRWI